MNTYAYVNDLGVVIKFIQVDRFPDWPENENVYQILLVEDEVNTLEEIQAAVTKIIKEKDWAQ